MNTDSFDHFDQIDAVKPLTYLRATANFETIGTAVKAGSILRVQRRADGHSGFAILVETASGVVPGWLSQANYRFVEIID